jgi:hypothetical protein
MLDRPLQAGQRPHRGDQIIAEAREYRGLHLKVIHGPVTYSSARLVEIHVDGQPEKIQRRRYLRSGITRRFATGVLVRETARRFFLVRPIDIGQGGVRFSHRLALRPGDRAQLTLRLEHGPTISPTAQIIETWPQPANAASQRPVPTTYVSRASFVELGHEEQAAIAHHVLKTLRSIQ